MKDRRFKIENDVAYADLGFEGIVRSLRESMGLLGFGSKKRATVEEMKANHDIGGLIKALNAKDRKTATDVVVALGDLRAPEAGATLASMLAALCIGIYNASLSLSNQHRSMAIGQYSPAKELAEIRESIERENPGVYALCFALCDALGKIGYAEAGSPLSLIADDRYFTESERLNAVKAMGMLGDGGREWLELLIAETNDKVIKSAAKSALSMLGERTDSKS